MVIGVATAGLATAGIAYAQGFGGHGHHHGSFLPPIVHQYVTHEQMHAVFQQYGPTLKSDMEAVKTARQTLETDLIAGSSNVPNDVTALQSAQNTLLQEKVTVAQAVLANLNSSQRTQVGNFVTAYRSMEQSNEASRKALFQQYGIGWGGSDSSSATSSPEATE
jgi:Spy/CpxP family protein refolding chaperone